MDLNNYYNSLGSVTRRQEELQNQATRQYDSSKAVASAKDLASSINTHSAIEHINQSFNIVDEGFLMKGLTGEGSKFLSKKMGGNIVNKVLKPSGNRLVSYLKGKNSFRSDMKNLPKKLLNGVDKLADQVDEAGSRYGVGAQKAGSQALEDVRGARTAVSDVGRGFTQTAQDIRGQLSRGVQTVRSKFGIGDPDESEGLLQRVESVDSQSIQGLGRPTLLPEAQQPFDEFAGPPTDTPTDFAGGVADIAGGAEEAATPSHRVISRAAAQAGRDMQGAREEASRVEWEGVSDKTLKGKMAAPEWDDAKQDYPVEHELQYRANEAATGDRGVEAGDVESAVVDDAESAAKGAAGVAEKGLVAAGGEAVADVADVGKAVAGVSDAAKVLEGGAAVLGAVDAIDQEIPIVDILTDAGTLAMAGVGYGLEKLSDYIAKKAGGNADSVKNVVKSVWSATSASEQLNINNK